MTNIGPLYYRNRLSGLCIAVTATTGPLCYTGTVSIASVLLGQSPWPPYYRDNLYGLCVAVTVTTGPLCYRDRLWPLYYRYSHHRTFMLQNQIIHYLSDAVTATKGPLCYRIRFSMTSVLQGYMERHHSYKVSLYGL